MCSKIEQDYPLLLALSEILSKDVGKVLYLGLDLSEQFQEYKEQSEKERDELCEGLRKTTGLQFECALTDYTEILERQSFFAGFILGIHLRREIGQV